MNNAKNLPFSAGTQPPGPTRLAKGLTMAAALMVGGIAGMVMVGWMIKSAALVQLNPAFVPMPFSTALLFFLSAVGLLAVSFQRPHFAAGVGIFILLSALATLLPYPPRLDFKIDPLFFTPLTVVKTLNFGRMALPSAFNFILTGFCLLMCVRKKESCQEVSLFLATAILIFSLSALCGYLFKIDSAYGWGSLTRMDLHTSASFSLLALGLMAFNWQGDHRFWPAVLVFFPGLLMSLFVLQIMSSAGEAHIRTLFTNDAHDLVSALNRQLEYTERTLHAGRAFYEGSKSVTRDEFRAFTQRTLEGVQSIQAVEWVENLPAEERLEFEERLHVEGFKDARVKEMSVDGGFVPAQSRPVYYPVTYTEPFQANEIVLGFDYGYDPLRKAAIERARDVNQTMATVPLHLFRDPDKRANGVLIFEPIYRNNTETSTLEGRRRHFTGVLTAVIRIPYFVNRALAYVMSKPLQFYLFDVSSPSQPVFAYASDAAFTPGQLEQFARTGFSLLTGLYHTEKLIFGGREYLVLIRADPLYLNQNRIWYPSVTFFLMLMLSLGATFFVVQAIFRNRELERFTGELGTARDTSENARNNLQAVLDAATDVSIIATDKCGMIKVFNRGAEKMLGWKAAEMIDLQTLEMIHLCSEVESRSQELSKFFGKPIEGFNVFVEYARRGSAEEREWTYVRKDGTYLTVSLVVTAVTNAQRELTGFLGIGVDITLEKQQKAELQRLVRQLEGQQKAMSQSVIVSETDVQGRITYANEQFCKISKYSREELLGRDHRIVNSGYHPKSFFKEMWEVIESGKVWRGEVKNRAKDGSYYWVDSTIAPLLDSQGKPEKYLSVRVVTTERKQAEEALRTACQAAFEASQAKSEFLATMSHEIRTPMNAILGMAELLSETPLNEEQLQYVRTLSRGGETLLSLINDVLDLSKIESGVVEIDDADYSVKEITERVVEVLAIAAHRKKIELTTVIPHEIPEVIEGDPARVRQILMNLIGNAIKFTEKGEVSVELERIGNQLQFSVCDTGIGIPEDKLDKIFNPFTQADSSTTRKYGGTGLGLSISKKLVELLGGKIWAESRPGEGSRFYFTLPLRVSAERTEGADGGAPEILKGKNVLIVDDNATNRLTVSKSVQRWGMAPSEASSGRECLELIRTRAMEGFHFDLILMDCRMPDIGGFEVAKKLKESPEFLPPMIIMLTSDNRSGDMEIARKLGFAAFLIKPIRRAELLMAVCDVFLKKNLLRPEAVRVVPKMATSPAPIKKILLAEDAPDNQELIKAFLKNEPYVVDVAENGKVALEMAVAGRYDLILMDIQMPEMDGYTATQLIRARDKKDPQGNRLKIVALTANALQKDADKCLAAGCDAYLSKPIKKAVLLETLAGYFVSKGA